MQQTMPDGSEKTVFSVIGKKLSKTQPEGFYTIVLMTRIEFGENGDNKYFFQTKANHSSAKTPMGMFEDFEIPNTSAASSALKNFSSISILLTPFHGTKCTTKICPCQYLFVHTSNYLSSAPDMSTYAHL